MNKKFVHFILRQGKSKTGDPERNVLVTSANITCLHSFSQLPTNADYQPKIKQKECGGLKMGRTGLLQGLMTIYAGAIFFRIAAGVLQHIEKGGKPLRL